MYLGWNRRWVPLFLRSYLSSIVAYKKLSHMEVQLYTWLLFAFVMLVG